MERKVLLLMIQNRICMQVLPGIFCRSSFLYWPQVVLGETRSRSLFIYERRDLQQKQLFIKKKPKHTHNKTSKTTTKAFQCTSVSSLQTGSTGHQEAPVSDLNHVLLYLGKKKDTMICLLPLEDTKSVQ